MIDEIIRIAKHAGNILIKCRDEDLELKFKSDKDDFLTKGDIDSDAYIRKQLSKLYQNDLILSEEEEKDRPTNFKGRVWMVDPLDGTTEYVNRGNSFSVMIGLCLNGKPILGVVYAPAQNLLYYAEKGKGSFMIKGKSKPVKLTVSNIEDIHKSTIVTRIIGNEKRKTDKMIKELNTSKQIQSSSVGVCLGLISQTKADTYIFTNKRGSKWDTCAPQIILEEAGGQITDYKGYKLDYKQKALQWKDMFIATNTKLHKDVLIHVNKYKFD